MKSDKNLSGQTKEAVYAIMKDRGEMTAEQVAELVRPYFIHDPEKSFEMELRRKVRQLMASFKDAEGVRVCFSDNKGLYINVDATADLPALRKVRRQLQRKYDGTNKALKKVKRREQVLVEGQLSLSDITDN